MPQKLVFLRRQSPDWGQLATDYATHGHVSPDLYKPRDEIPGFPPNIEELIDRWNRLFGLDFFLCRQELKRIAEKTLCEVESAVIQDYDPTYRLRVSDREAFAFFVDDDDWFSPTSGTAPLPRETHLVTFPLVRLMLNVNTFVPTGQSARTIIGKRQDFHFTFQTNNYGINLALWPDADLSPMKDHVLASRYFHTQRLTNLYIDRIISITNKTPAAASMLRLIQNEQLFVNYVAAYIRHVERVRWPDELHWARKPVSQTLYLFREVLRSRRR